MVPKTNQDAPGRDESQKEYQDRDKVTMSDCRAKLDVMMDSYRDAAFWAGYKAAKDEILELYASGEIW